MAFGGGCFFDYDLLHALFDGGVVAGWLSFGMGGGLAGVSGADGAGGVECGGLAGGVGGEQECGVEGGGAGVGLVVAGGGGGADLFDERGAEGE